MIVILFVIILLIYLGYIIIKSLLRYKCSQSCSQPYRLADFIIYDDQKNSKDTWKKLTQKCWPDSLAAEYWKNTNKFNNTEALVKSINNKCNKYIEDDEVAIHLRLGDTACDDKLTYYTPPENYKIKFDELNIDKTLPRTIYTGNHTSKCIKEHNDITTKITSELGGKLAKPGSADEHFCKMVNAHTFIQGGGGYSRLIAKARNTMGKKNTYVIRRFDPGIDN